jgi:predicted Fe-S protein YdhL (DUF1289 family)
MEKMVKSPCILVCKLENDVCIGCKRTKEEITMWTKYSDEEKQNVLSKQNKKVIITRLRVREKRKYSVPAKYSSHTQYELFIDEKSVYVCVLNERFRTLKQFVEWSKKKYNFSEYSIFNMGSHNI